LIKKQLRLNMWDAWGITDVNYKNLSVKNFLDGKVRPGTPMEIEVNEMASRNIALGDSVMDHRIHAVVFIIPIGDGQDEFKLALWETHITQCLERGITPVLVVNYIKTVKREEDLAANLDKIKSCSHLEDNEIFKHDNYVAEDFRNMKTDLSYRTILERAFVQARKTIARNPSKIGNPAPPQVGYSIPPQVGYPIPPQGNSNPPQQRFDKMQVEKNVVPMTIEEPVRPPPVKPIFVLCNGVMKEVELSSAVAPPALIQALAVTFGIDTTRSTWSLKNQRGVILGANYPVRNQVEPRETLEIVSAQDVIRL